MPTYETKKPTMTVSRDGSRSYTRTLRYEGSDTIGAQQAFELSGLTLGEPYSSQGDSDPAAVLVSASVNPIDQKRAFWTISATYSSSSRDGDSAGGDGEIDPDPTKRPAEITASGSFAPEPLIREADGKVVTNTLGQPLPFSVSIERTHVILDVRKNFALFPAEDIFQYMGKINSLEFLGFPAFHVRCSGVSGGNYEYENGIPFLPMRFQFDVKTDPWNPIYLPNLSTAPLNDSLVESSARRWDFQNQAFVEEPLGAPVYLRDDGRQHRPGVDSDSDKLVEVTAYETIDFNQLNLGITDV